MFKNVSHPRITTEAAFDCHATAGLLRSMRGLEWASHFVAMVAIVNSAWFSLLAWGLVLYFAVRVRLDAELLELLADDSECAPRRLDKWLSSAGLRTPRGERSIEDRCKGSRRLARSLVIAFLLQCTLTAWALGNRHL